MRCWHKSLVKYLPKNQLRGQWRECALIARSIKENGTPNHLLVNRVLEYPYCEFESYCDIVQAEMRKRGYRILQKCYDKIHGDRKEVYFGNIFKDWHNAEYLRVCMANLYEKHFFGIGKSRITDEEWQRLCEGYKEITGEDYVI